MNKNLAEGLALIDEILLSETDSNVLKIIACPYIHIAAAAEKVKNMSGFEIAAQNCHHRESGAFTGEISAAMIRSSETKYVIIGHSERRRYFNETNALLSQKVSTALANDLTPIFCIGENMEERNANQHLEIVKQQLKESLFHLSSADFSRLVVAYEPVWAIGTGLTATSHQAQGMHNYIRSEINKKYGKDVSENITILYGGSCNAENAKELFSCIDVDGGLIGGASLKAKDFIAIANSF